MFSKPDRLKCVLFLLLFLPPIWDKHYFKQIIVLILIHFASSAEGGVTLDKSPVHSRADIWRQTTIHTYIHTYRQFRVTN